MPESRHRAERTLILCFDGTAGEFDETVSIWVRAMFAMLIID